MFEYFLLACIMLPGHSWTLQLSSIDAGPGHSSPPCCAPCFSVLVFVLIPPPHSLSHSPITQSFHSQWTKENKNHVWNHKISSLHKYNNFLRRLSICNVHTWAFPLKAAYGFAWWSTAASSVLLMHSLCSGVVSCTVATRNGTLTDIPAIPFTMDWSGRLACLWNFLIEDTHWQAQRLAINMKF